MKDLIVILVIVITLILTYTLMCPRKDNFVNELPVDIEDSLGAGVSMSIMERRGDQGYFAKVASRTRTKNSQFDQTITQAQLL